MNPKKPISRQYYTRSKARAMAENPATRIDWLEKAYLELQQQYAKSCDNIYQMMEMLKLLTREKQSAETPNTQIEAISIRGTRKNTPYPQSFALPCKT